ncbi:MAG: 50S ribosomal protein L35 [Oscillospiraceae bacterium]|jgi:large subunit ribosomal protein L35|nr:50S ribosomal protein L35 [Oscillospiraceae bacterium]
MPKIKTHSGAKKRFKLSKSGKPMRACACTGHDIKGRKNAKKKRALRGTKVADSTNAKQIKRLIPYK